MSDNVKRPQTSDTDGQNDQPVSEQPAGLGRHNADIDMDEGKLHHGTVGGNMKSEDDDTGEPGTTSVKQEIPNGGKEGKR